MQSVIEDAPLILSFTIPKKEKDIEFLMSLEKGHNF